MKIPLSLLCTSCCFAAIAAPFENTEVFLGEFLTAQETILVARGLVKPSSVNPAPIDGYVAVKLVNNSGLGDDAVYLLVKGQNGSSEQCFLEIANGLGDYAVVSTSSFSQDYSYRFSDLPGIVGQRYFYVPQPFISGRIYFSINYPLLMAIEPDGSTGDLTIVDPSHFSTKDPNYYTLYDKIELTFTTANPSVDLYTNPTAVDFFSLPLYLQMNNPVSGGLSASGFNQSRNTLLSGVETAFATFDRTSTEVWNRLLLPFYSDPYDSSPTVSTYLRITAPAPACAPGASSVNPDQTFPSDYLSNAGVYGFDYIDNVWDFYKGTGNQITIDATEIASTFGPGPGSPSYPQYYYFTGTVNSSDVFVYVNGTNNYTWTMQKPTSAYPFFAGANFIDDGEANNTPGAVIVRQFTSAFEVGVLPQTFPTGGFPFMNRPYFESQKANYYTPNAEWGTPGANNGPFYDLYSKALHSFGNLIYTFAYDDALGQDGTLIGAVEGLGSSMVITVGAVDTPVPDPFTDSSLYTVGFQAAMNNPVSYRQGTTGAFTAAPTFPTTVANLSSNSTTPFQIKLKDLDGNDQILTLYLKYNIVIPETTDFGLASGVVINHSTATSVTLQTPSI